jgi:hypothetical protein
MQMGMSAIFDSEKEAIDSERYPFIRLLGVSLASAPIPQENVQIDQNYKWSKPSRNAFKQNWLESFSAVW